MTRLLSIIALIGISATALPAQQTPASSSSAQSQVDSTPQPEQTDATRAQQSVRSFEGKIISSGGHLVLQDRAAQTSYKLDDQDKAKQYQDRNVKVMATMDLKDKSLLHIIDITGSSKPH